jgi:hypothetical protein
VERERNVRNRKLKSAFFIGDNGLIWIISRSGVLIRFGCSMPTSDDGCA